MTYNPDIPEADDIVANSQSQILANFQQLNAVYGTSGDHYAYNNATGVEQKRHAKVTLPRLPSANAPGNVIPTPAANEGVAYVKVAGTQSIPYFRKDTGTLDFPLLPVRAMGRFTRATSVIIGTAFNCSTFNVSSSKTRIVFTEAMPDANYLVLFGGLSTVSGNNPVVSSDDTFNANEFTVIVPANNSQIFFAVLHYL